MPSVVFVDGIGEARGLPRHAEAPRGRGRRAGQKLEEADRARVAARVRIEGRFLARDREHHGPLDRRPRRGRRRQSRGREGGEIDGQPALRRALAGRSAKRWLAHALADLMERHDLVGLRQRVRQMREERPRLVAETGGREQADGAHGRALIEAWRAPASAARGPRSSIWVWPSFASASWP